jgi:hypothetical protein
MNIILGCPYLNHFDSFSEPRTIRISKLNVIEINPNEEPQKFHPTAQINFKVK